MGSSSSNNWASIKEVLPQIFAVTVKNILLLAFGMSLGLSTILIPAFSGNDPDETILLEDEAISWIASINLICVPIGCVVTGSLTHALGRRRMMQMVNIPLLAAFIMLHFSTEPWHILTALAITGLTGGILEAPVLTYVAEITQPHVRGMLSSTSTMSVILGVLIEFLLGTFISWRQVVLLNCIGPVLSFVLLILVPESPIFLISKNRLVEAQSSLAWLRGWTTNENVKPEFDELCHQIKDKESNKKEGVLDAVSLVTKSNFLQPLFLVSLAFFLFNFNGNYPLQTYAITIFTSLRISIDEYYATILVGLVQFFGCIGCTFLVNILGKRMITFISLIGAGVCYFIVATYAYCMGIKSLTDQPPANNDTLEAYSWIPVTFLVLSSLLSYLGISVLPWILIGEVFSNETRAIGSGIASGIGYVFGFLTNKIFLNLVTGMTLPGVFWLYSGIGLLGMVIMYFILPETEGKPLHEISEHFAGVSKLRKSVRKKMDVVGAYTNSGFKAESEESPDIDQKLPEV